MKVKITPKLKQILNTVCKEELKELRKQKPKQTKTKKQKPIVRCVDCKKAVLSDNQLECWCPEKKSFRNPFWNKSCKLFIQK